MKKDDGRLLPRDHFSWTQLNIWCKSKEQYRRRYFVPESPEWDSRETIFGKKIAKILEDRKFDESGHGGLKEVVEGFETSEHPVRVEVCGVMIKAYIDLYRK